MYITIGIRSIIMSSSVSINGMSLVGLMLLLRFFMSEGLTQAILVGMILVGRSGVSVSTFWHLQPLTHPLGPFTEHPCASRMRPPNMPKARLWISWVAGETVVHRWCNMLLFRLLRAGWKGVNNVNSKRGGTTQNVSDGYWIVRTREGDDKKHTAPAVIFVSSQAQKLRLPKVIISIPIYIYICI